MGRGGVPRDPDREERDLLGRGRGAQTRRTKAWEGRESPGDRDLVGGGVWRSLAQTVKDRPAMQEIRV